MTQARWQQLTEWPLAIVAVGGIAMLGVVTATLASWIVERVAQTEDHTRAATRGQIMELSAQIAQLHELLEKKSA